MKGRFFVGFWCVVVILFGFVGCFNKKTVYSYEIVEEKEETESLDKELSYPVFDDLEIVNKKISSLLDDLFSSYKNEFDSWTEYDEFNREFSPDAKTNPYGYYVEPESVIANNSFVSVVFSCYVFTGGAHGNTSFVSFTYDVVNDKFVSITDASNLSLDVISQRCFEELKKVDELQTDDDSWIKEGTAPIIENYKNFSFDGKVLTVYFAPYQVAPYAAGWHEVSIKI